MRRRGCLHSLMIWAAVGLIAAGFWQYQNNILAAEPFSVASDRLPTAFDGLRIVVVSDLHGKTFGPGNETLLEEIRAAHGDVYTVLLAHRNEDLPRWAALGVDVVLCGHAHGGVIRLPFVGGLLGTDRQLFPEFTAGLYTENRTSMVVSRGLGNSGVPFRLFNRPHLPVVSLETVSQP